MTDSAQSSPSKDVGFDQDFYAMLDEMLEAPTRKSRSKSSKSKKKKSSSSHRSRSAYDSPASSPTKSDVPLSPHLEESVDDTTFFPRNVAAADLDDSILGGLMGGGKKPTFKPSNTERKNDNAFVTDPVAAPSSKGRDLSVKTTVVDEFDDSFAVSHDDTSKRAPASTTAAAATSSFSASTAASRPSTTMSSSLRNVKSWDDPPPAKASFGSRRAKSTAASVNNGAHHDDEPFSSSVPPAKDVASDVASAAPVSSTDRAKTFSFNDSFNDDDLLPLPDDSEADKAKQSQADDALPAPSFGRGESNNSDSRLNTATSMTSAQSADDATSRRVL